MICEAQYDSLEAIPEALRGEFEQVNGKWQLKASAIPGVGPLFNSALAANERKAVDQVKARNERIRNLEEENNQLKDKLSVLDSPGNKVLSKADAETFDAYTALGTPQEIKNRLEKLPELEEKVVKFETSASLAEVAKANGLAGVTINPEVLSDWLAASENKGVSVFVKTEERTDSKGAKVSLEVPYVRIEEKAEGGKVTVSEKELLTFAKEKMPEWKYTALVSGSSAAPAPNAPAPAPAKGMKVPDLGSARQEPGSDTDKKRPVDKFNEQRSKKPNPFSRPLTAVPGAMPPIR